MARELRHPADRRLSSERRVCRAHPQGRRAGRIAICADRPLRVGHKLEDRQGAWPCPLQLDAVACRRSDRVAMLFAALHLVRCWPKADIEMVGEGCPISGVKADITI
jgi:hypothetical protein